MSNEEVDKVGAADGFEVNERELAAAHVHAGHVTHAAHLPHQLEVVNTLIGKLLLVKLQYRRMEMGAE